MKHNKPYVQGPNGNMVSDSNKGISSISYNVLNKPETITFDDGAKLIYTYNAMGMQLKQELEVGGSIVKTTDYVNGHVYQNDTLQFFSHPEGRVVANLDGSLEYQYAYTDHLGNVRMIYTSETDTVKYLATMEMDVVDQVDDEFFTGIVNTRTTDPRSGQGNNEVSHLYATQPIGAGLAVPFYPGDTIEISVKAFHLGGDFSNTTTISALASALASAFVGKLNTGSEQQLNTAFDNAYNNAIIGDGTSTRPSAYLNYLYFDQNMNYIPELSGFQQVSESGNEEILSEIKVATTAGYLYTYVSNESGAQNNGEVYFDDFEVIIKEGMIVQNTDYYPFGLQHSTSWTRITDMKNNFLFNAGSELNEQTKNYETFYRHYDPALGRMTAIDPVAAKYSSHTPYNYAFNDPIALNDPMGDDPYNQRREFTGDTWAMQEAYYRDENPHFQMKAWYSGDRQGFRITNKDIGTANFIGAGEGSMRADHWSYGMGSIGFNFGMMSTNEFKDFYGVDNMSESEKANFASGLSRAPTEKEARSYAPMMFGKLRGFNNRGMINHNNHGLIQFDKTTGAWFLPHTDVSYWDYLDMQNRVTQSSQGGASVESALASAWAIALAEPTPIGEGLMVAVTAATAVVYGPKLLDKMEKELRGLATKISGPQGVVYALVAPKDGIYNVYSHGSAFPTSKTYLKAGEIWKYGETTSEERYDPAYLSSEGVRFVPLYPGNQIEIKMMEKFLIYGHFGYKGKLPAGNKMFR